VLVLANTGGLTGAEVGIATAASAANQALLARLLGDQNLRWLVSRSREELQTRFAELAAEQARRHLDALAQAAPEPAEVERLRLATALLEEGER
jgi:hypothetical protein